MTFIAILCLISAGCSAPEATTAAPPSPQAETQAPFASPTRASPSSTRGATSTPLSPDTPAASPLYPPPASEAPYPPLSPVGVPQAYSPQDTDVELSPDRVFVDRTEVLTMESFPPQFALIIAGSLPTPCHRLRIEIEPPTAGELAVVAYSLVDANIICTQVLEAFEARLPLSGLPSGDFTVTVNGETAGEISVP